MTEDELRTATQLVARLKRCEELFKRSHEMPFFHEAEGCRYRLRRLGVECPPGDGWGLGAVV